MWRLAPQASHALSLASLKRVHLGHCTVSPSSPTSSSELSEAGPHSRYSSLGVVRSSSAMSLDLAQMEQIFDPPSLRKVQARHSHLLLPLLLSGGGGGWAVPPPAALCRLRFWGRAGGGASVGTGGCRGLV